MNGIPVRNPDVAWRDEPHLKAAIVKDAEAGEAIEERPWVFVIDGEGMHPLNLVAGDIWCLLDGSRSIQEVADELARQYEVPPDEVLHDVDAFVAECVGKGWVLLKELH